MDETQKPVLYQQWRAIEPPTFEFCGSLFCLSPSAYSFSVLFALWFAERLSKPIGRLAGVAKRVGAGELTTQVIEDDGDDEISQPAVILIK